MSDLRNRVGDLLECLDGPDPREWVDLDTVRELARAYLALAARPAAADDFGMAAFGASDAACYKWPEDSELHRACRAAYMEGAADTHPADAAEPASCQWCLRLRAALEPFTESTWDDSDYEVARRQLAEFNASRARATRARPGEGVRVREYLLCDERMGNMPKMRNFVFDDYASEVEAEAERMVRDGEGAPWDAIGRAHKRVQERRQAEAHRRYLEEAKQRRPRKP